MKTPVDTHRKTWNKNQKQLRSLVNNSACHQEAIDLFLIQHGALHSAAVAPEASWSYEDILFEDLPDEVFRRLPPRAEHSIAWLVWHIARCEDITMNILTAGKAQVLDDWQAQLKISAADTGNTMSREEITELSSTIDRQALRGYRAAVGASTRKVVRHLTPKQLKTKVDPARLQIILDQGAVLPGAIELVEWWGRRTIAGLLVMPPTRHNLVHLNQAYNLKFKKA